MRVPHTFSLIIPIHRRAVGREEIVPGVGGKKKLTLHFPRQFDRLRTEIAADDDLLSPLAALIREELRMLREKQSEVSVFQRIASVP